MIQCSKDPALYDITWYNLVQIFRSLIENQVFLYGYLAIGFLNQVLRRQNSFYVLPGLISIPVSDKPFSLSKQFLLSVSVFMRQTLIMQAWKKMGIKSLNVFTVKLFLKKNVQNFLIIVMRFCFLTLIQSNFGGLLIFIAWKWPKKSKWFKINSMKTC